MAEVEQVVEPEPVAVLPEPEPEPVAVMPEPEPVAAAVEVDVEVEPKPVGVRPISHEPKQDDTQDAYANWWTVQLGSPLEAA